MRIFAKLVAITIITLSAAPTSACRYFKPADDKVANGYENNIITGVALIEIRSSKSTRAPHGDAKPWAATGEVERVLSGSVDAATVTFERGGGSAACQEDISAPKKGDRWIVYFWTNRDNVQQVWASYPAQMARAADPKISVR